MAKEPTMGRVGVAPSLAPLPDMQLCAQCEELHVGYYRESGEFVCCECWGNYMAAGLVEDASEPKHEPAEQRCPACGEELPCLTHYALRTAPALERCRRCGAPHMPPDYCSDPACPYEEPEEEFVTSVGGRTRRTGAEPAELAERVPDALLPWLRGVVAYARRH